jgi:hypothetical protein
MLAPARIATVERTRRSASSVLMTKRWRTKTAYWAPSCLYRLDRPFLLGARPSRLVGQAPRRDDERIGSTPLSENSLRLKE